MTVSLMTTGNMMGSCEHPDRWWMRCLIHWKDGADGYEACIERQLRAYMISGRVYSIICIFPPIYELNFPK